MLHMYAVVLAVVLLVGALAAIIICVCVDIVPIIKSRGSTLVSRDSVTQEQTRMLKKSLQLKKLSASVDLIDSVHGRKTLAQALKSERPRFGSTPLSLLTGSGENDSDLQIKTTTVIMEALPKKSPLAESNNNNDGNKTERDVTDDSTAQKEDTPIEQGNERYNSRQENVYVDNKISKIIARRTKSEGSPNINGRRAKSDLLEDGSSSHAKKGAMTYNPRIDMDTESQPRSYPNSPDVRISRPTSSQQDDVISSSREHIPDSGQRVVDRIPPSHNQQSVRSKLYPRYGNSPTEHREYPLDARGIPLDNCGVPEHSEEIPAQNCDSAYCKWCQIERDRNMKDRAREHPLPFRRSESFPENYHANSSPKIGRNIPRQHSFDEQDNVSRGIPYDRNKYCKTPHRGYSPCPDCFHQQPYYYTYQGDRNSPTFMVPVPNSAMGNVPKPPGQMAGPPAQMAALLSSSSSSSSSGSSSRFRHLRQPLEDIQEDASDCYAVRDTEVTSTIDSRELSSPDDDTMPKSTENSSTSVSPLVLSENQPSMVSASGS